jgi:fluoroacetyl-CoA thioesterase
MSWQERIASGDAGTHTVTISPELTAHSLGNTGIHVLATAIVGVNAEQALYNLIIPWVPEGFGLIGVRQQTFHKAPAPVGTTVTWTAVVQQIEGSRVHYTFIVKTAAGTLLAEGDGESAVVDMEKFLRRAGVW